jgi:hypothetical protein
MDLLGNYRQGLFLCLKSTTINRWYSMDKPFSDSSHERIEKVQGLGATPETQAPVMCHDNLPSSPSRLSPTRDCLFHSVTQHSPTLPHPDNPTTCPGSREYLATFSHREALNEAFFVSLLSQD